MKVLIVGGGPVGLAAAIRARLRGMEAIVFDRQRPPIDKACGEGLMPGGVQALRDLGVQIPQAHAFGGIRYFQEDHPHEAVAEGRFSHGGGFGIRRLALHESLVKRAEEVGVDLRWETHVTRLEPNALHTDTERIHGDWIVGADGLHSPIRKWAGLERKHKKPQRYGLRRHYAIAPWSDCVEVYWTRGCEAYVTPTSPESVGVAILWHQNQHQPKRDHPISPFPRLQERIATADFLSIPRGAGPLRREVTRVQKDRLLLVGDAAGYVDALTGEGLALGFRQAEAAISAIENNQPNRYRSAHRALCRRPFFLTKTLRWIAAHPGIRRRVIRGLAKDPVLFSRFLDLMEGEAGWSQLGLLRTTRLLGGLAFPTRTSPTASPSK